MSNTMIYNANIVTEESVIEGGYVIVADGIITAIGSGDIPESAWSGEQVDAKGAWLIPGFVDVHIHGGYGADFMDGSVASVDTIARFHGGHGTTSIVATTLTNPYEQLTKALEAVEQYRSQEMLYAQIVGVHLEGPFINVAYKGAQNPAYIVPPRKDWIKGWLERFPGLIMQLSLAPEIEGALELITWARGQGINIAAAHTNATYDEVIAAADAGLNQAVHTFNAMTGLHHRNPGTVGAVLTDDRIYAEIIADGHHVHPACIKLLAKAKTKNNLMLITDAMSAAGLDDGLYDLGGLAVVVKDGVAVLKEGNSLAGSTLTMIEAFRNAIAMIGLTVPEASRLSSTNAAKQIGIYDQTGSIAIGKRADLLLVEQDLQLSHVWAKGRAVPLFQRDEV